MHKLIGLVKMRFLQYVTEAEALLSSPIQSKVLEENEMNTEDLIECMNNSLSILE